MDLEEADRVAADLALDTKIVQETNDRIADVDTEEAERVADVNEEESDRIADVNDEEDARILDVDIEEAARVAGDDALEALIHAEIAALSAYVDAAIAALSAYVDAQDAHLQLQIDDNANSIDLLTTISNDHEDRLLVLEDPERHGRQNYHTPGTYSFTVPTGVNRIWITAVGAGGGAATRGQGLKLFTGGDGASYFQYELDVQAGQQIDFEIGVGGASVIGPGLQAEKGDSTYVDWDGDPFNGAGLEAKGGKGADVLDPYGGSNGANSFPIEGPMLRWNGNGSQDPTLPGGDGMVRLEW
ncbi:MAG: hypothetical protein QF524_03960 [Planctomycetota bacterium]|nr:hypothetical protein [Planctomycetota bacterium]